MRTGWGGRARSSGPRGDGTERAPAPQPDHRGPVPVTSWAARAAPGRGRKGGRTQLAAPLATQVIVRPPRVGGGFPWWGDCPSGALPAPPGRQAAGSPLSSPAPARPPPRRLGEKPRCSVQRFSRRLPGAGGGRAVFSPFSSEATESQPLPGVRNGASLERSAGPDVESNTPASSLPPACVRPRETARGLRRGFGLGP